MQIPWEIAGVPADGAAPLNLKLGFLDRETIHDRGFGEVKKPETVNYRTYRPEPAGLFCEEIFGQVMDSTDGRGDPDAYAAAWKAAIEAVPRGEDPVPSDSPAGRIGWVDLGVPILHPFFRKHRKSEVAGLCGLNEENLERLISSEVFVVVETQDSGLDVGQVVEEDELGDRARVETGGTAIRALIEEGWGDAPAVMDTVPVLPAVLRPMVPLEGGRWATSDLNDLYRRLINRNNRLKRLMELNAPEIIVRNERRMLQQALDALFDNSGPKPVTGKDGPLKSLRDLLVGGDPQSRVSRLDRLTSFDDLPADLFRLVRYVESVGLSITFSH